MYYTFSSDCQKDRVTFIPYQQDGSKEVQRIDLCRSDTLPSKQLPINSGRVIIEFVSDDARTDRGFLFSYQALDKEGINLSHFNMHLDD